MDSQYMLLPRPGKGSRVELVVGGTSVAQIYRALIDCWSVKMLVGGQIDGGFITRKMAIEAVLKHHAKKAA